MPIRPGISNVRGRMSKGKTHSNGINIRMVSIAVQFVRHATRDTATYLTISGLAHGKRYYPIGNVVGADRQNI